MDQLETKNLKDFTRGKNAEQEVVFPKKIHSISFRTKPGCYCPPPYQLKYRNLSEVLK